ncbi:MAG: aromatic amino acid ammonia-lyase [Fretibacterium sp.]|nr:aromatic amino acid ammonia-lyase [Fretibacterium sp.]
MEPLVLTGKDLSLADLYSVVYDRRKVALQERAKERAMASRQILFDMAAAGKPVYGLNRGVGWNKDTEFDSSFFEQYNKNVLNTHSVGVGDLSSSEEVRAMMLIRLNKALLGHVGISVEILELYCAFLNEGIHPQVPRRSSVGEGDITALAHIGLAFIGEGTVEYGGRVLPAGEALKLCGLKPVVLGPKDGLGILSSNAQGEALAALFLRDAETLVATANGVFALSLEGLNGVMESLREDVNGVRGLAGQIRSARECRALLEGSFLHLPDPARALQDPLCFRCAHAVSGTVYDALDYVRSILEVQINATDDNPCILLEAGRSYVSPNFETLSLALAVEMAASALSHLSKMSCYRMLKLADPAFTKLTRALTPKEVEVLAFTTVQKTFTMLDAENRLWANPSSMDYYAVSGTIEDHASNLPLAADKASRIVGNLHYILGIELMHAAQAVDLRGKKPLGEGTRKIYETFRRAVPFYDRDRNLSRDIEKARELLASGDLLPSF